MKSTNDHLRIWVQALAITLCQILFVLLFSGSSNWMDKWLSLFHWDSDWYQTIVKNGYVSTIPPVAQNGEFSNVAFFPGYPLLSRIFYLLTQSDPRVIMLLISQISCVCFWAFFLKVLNQFNFRRETKGFAVFLVLSFPTSFYLVSAYAESLFMASLMGFLYFGYSRKRLSSLAKSGAAGSVMTATRIFGVPVAASFFVQRIVLWASSFFQTRKYSIKKYDFLLPLYSWVGVSLFFIYCHARWGRWNLYEQTQKIGWGVQATYSAFFDSDLWIWETPHLNWHVPDFDTNFFSKLLSRYYTWTILLLIGIEIFFAQKPRLLNFIKSRRFPLYFSATLMHVLAIVGLFSMGLRSMSRYLLPVHILLVIAFISFLQERFKFQKLTLEVLTSFAVLFLLLCGTFFMIQKILIERFTTGQWVS